MHTFILCTVYILHAAFIKKKQVVCHSYHTHCLLFIFPEDHASSAELSSMMLVLLVVCLGIAVWLLGWSRWLLSGCLCDILIPRNDSGP